MTLHCINLPRAVERRQQIEQHWRKQQGFDLKFFPAFDRREIEAGAKLPFHYDAEATINRIKRPLSSAEIACAISHTLLLRQALASGQDDLLVLEDDMVPTSMTTPDSVADAIATCKAEFPRVSVLLMHESAGPVSIVETKAGIQLLRRAPYGYRFVWLSRKAMEILARDLATLYYPADWLWSLRFAPMKNVAMLAKPLAHHPGNQTYIGNSFRAGTRIYLP